MSNEEQRAKKFVERHFPVTAAFLAAERGEGPVPVYGPGETQNVHDDQPEPWVKVRVDYQLSRFELFAVVAAGYASTNIGQNPDDMSVQQIRDDVEAHLAGTSSLELDALVEEVAGQIERGDHPDQMAALLRAMDRAYRPRNEREPIMQQPRYGDGTVTLQTLDHGEVTITEPRWCMGHNAEAVVHRVDITHNGRPVFAEVETDLGTEQLLEASISWAPFAELQPEPYPVAALGDLPPMDPAQLRAVAAELGLYVGRLYRLSNELDRIRRAES
ncbi:DUF6907 domain-containing protein [Streptomyces sp. NPDC002144]